MPLSTVEGSVANSQLPIGSPSVIDASTPQSSTSSTVSCSHCGLPVPPALVHAEAAHAFCCSGCETVYHLLQGAGLDGYYAFRDQVGGSTERGREGDETRVVEFDTDAFHSIYCSVLPSGLTRVELLVEGVHCAACVWLVERLPRLESSVREARLDVVRSSLTLTWDATEAPLSQIASTLGSMGYRPRPLRGQEAARMRRDELRSLMIRMGVAGASAGNVMLMAFALYSGESGFDEAQTMSADARRFFEVLSLVVSLPALWAGGVFIRGALSALRTRTAHMDLPIALGITVGFVWGAYGVFSAQGEIFFDSITALIFFLLVGRYLQRRHQMSAADAAELLHAVVPDEARMCSADGIVGDSLPTNQVTSGMCVVVDSGEVVPVDGIVRHGRSALDKSLLSGESHPISVGESSPVEAGAVNLQARLVIEATKDGGQTRVADIMRGVEKALSTRTPLVGQADRLAGRFTLVVIGLATLTAFYWSFQSPELAVQRALALLIVACPCALGLATPLALSAAVNQAAKQKKLVFTPEALEQLARPTELVLDKTGTLTEGAMSVVDWKGNVDLLGAALWLEQSSKHPVAHAIRTFALSQQAQGPDWDATVNERLGAGLCSETPEGKFAIGSPAFIVDRAELSPELESFLNEDRSETPVLMERDGCVVAVFWVGDALRSDAVSSLIELHRAGHRLHLLSGDHTRTVERTAAELSELAGVQLFTSVKGEATPEDKLSAIAGLAAGTRPVVMVGDGVNDAGALARADVGVAVKGAAEASRLSTDVYLSRNGLRALVELMTGSRRVLGAVRRGIGFSLAYNALGISGAILGMIGPLGAAILMPLSSLTVVTNAYKSQMFRKESPS